MFKNLLRSRHDASSKDANRSLPPQYGHGAKQPLNDTPPDYAVSPVDYSYEGPRMWSETSAYSVDPVEYRQSPLESGGPPPPAAKPTSATSITPVEYRQSPFAPAGPPPPAAKPTSAFSVNPVEYRQSPLAPAGPPPPAAKPTSAFSVNPIEYRQSPMGYSHMGAPGPPVASSTQSPFPVDYQASAPMPTSRQAARPKHVANDQRQNQPPLAPARYTYTVDALPPRSADQPQDLATGGQSYSKFAYYGPGPQRPAELPASSVPPRCELPTNSIYRPAFATPPSPLPNTRPSPNPGWTSPTGSSTTTLVPSPRPDAQSPMFPGTNPGPFPSPSQTPKDDDGIKKFVIDIYCPMKRDANGNRREQIPCDVREFRLAKVALIPIVAGKRTFVSFDVVFGEIDKVYSDLVEKHFSCSHLTRLTEVDAGMVRGGQVYTIGPLNIAYRDGESASVYVKFPTVEDKSKFNAAFWDMWPYVEQPAN